MTAVVKGSEPAPTRRGGPCGAGVRKPPKEETAGRKGLFRRRTPYGDLKIAGWALVSLRDPEARDFVGLDEVSGLGWRRRHEGWA